MGKVKTGSKKLKNKSKEQVLGFMDFVRQQGVIGLAIGLAIGAAAGAAVKAIVDGLISPLVGFILGGTDLTSLVWRTGLVNGSNELVFAWGSVLNAFIILLTTAAVIYYVVKGFRLDKLDKEKTKHE